MQDVGCPIPVFNAGYWSGENSSGGASQRSGGGSALESAVSVVGVQTGGPGSKYMSGFKHGIYVGTTGTLLLVAATYALYRTIKHSQIKKRTELKRI